MVLDIFVAGVNTLIPSRHWLRYAAGGVGLLVVHALFQGRKTTRERDLHSRVVIITVSHRSFLIIIFLFVTTIGS